MKVPAVDTPLSIIALFVALIELFLAYPVTQLQGPERMILLVFMTAFPFLVASAFFFILWYRPIHLYRPQDITPGLESRYQADITELARLKADNEELREESQRLRQRAMPTETAVLPPAKAEPIEEVAGVTAITRAKELGAGEMTTTQAPPAPGDDRSDVEQ